MTILCGPLMKLWFRHKRFCVC